VKKAKGILDSVKVLRVYFNNHYGTKAVYNALRFREMAGESLNANEQQMIAQLGSYLENKGTA
jgi:uncharacterized protein YecE (DUF72 family)